LKEHSAQGTIRRTRPRIAKGTEASLLETGSAPMRAQNADDLNNEICERAGHPQ
jgi:hypothetical protein